MKVNSTIVFIFALTLCAVAVSKVMSQQGKNTLAETVKLLQKMDSVHPTKELVKLFNEGDTRIPDLEKALNSDDRTISLNSQRILRYLGSRASIDTLKRYYEQSTVERSFTGSVPIPISDFDYQLFESSKRADQRFVHALLFDGSQKAKSILQEVLKRPGFMSDGCTIATTNSIPNFDPKSSFDVNGDLAQAVVKNAFFICKSDLQYVEAKTVAFNSDKSKALIYLKIDRGPLAEEWYHIVVEKTQKGWKYFSVTQVAVS